jgi:hypothetical protein
MFAQKNFGNKRFYSGQLAFSNIPNILKVFVGS